METDSEVNYDSDSERCYDSGSDAEDEYTCRNCVERVNRIHPGGRFQITRSQDLKSHKLHRITTQLFELREVGGVASQTKLDRITKEHYVHFKNQRRYNLAFTMKLLKFKNLYFRKDYERGIQVLRRLNRNMDKLDNIIDETYIRGKLQFNLAYAYFATKKHEKARICLYRAKEHLHNTEGGEDKADMFYFEGKLMDYYAQKCKVKANSTNRALQSYRDQAVAAYRSSRDNVLSEGSDDYLRQRAIYRSLQMCKVYLDFPEIESCRKRNIVTKEDLDRATDLLREIELSQTQITLSPRLKSRLDLARAEVSFRESQLCEKNKDIPGAADKIRTATDIVSRVHNDLINTNFAERQTSLKMLDIYQRDLHRLDTRLSMTRSRISSSDSPNESAKDTNDSQKGENVEYNALTANQRTRDEAYRCVLELDFSGDDFSCSEILVSMESYDRESDCF